MKIYSAANFGEGLLGPEAEFEECEFQGVAFSSWSIKGVSFLDCKFTHCNLANQVLTNASVRNVEFEGCNLIGINWSGLKRLENPKFIDCKLDFSCFQGLKLKKMELVGSSAIDVDFSEADLTHSKFSNNDFTGSSWAGTILNGVDFRRSRGYLFDLRTAKIKGAKFNSPEVVSLIVALGAEVEI